MRNPKGNTIVTFIVSGGDLKEIAKEKMDRAGDYFLDVMRIVPAIMLATIIVMIVLDKLFTHNSFPSLYLLVEITVIQLGFIFLHEKRHGVHKLLPLALLPLIVLIGEFSYSFWTGRSHVPFSTTTFSVLLIMGHISLVPHEKLPKTEGVPSRTLPKLPNDYQKNIPAPDSPFERRFRFGVLASAMSIGIIATHFLALFFTDASASNSDLVIGIVLMTISLWVHFVMMRAVNPRYPSSVYYGGILAVSLAFPLVIGFLRNSDSLSYLVTSELYSDDTLPGFSFGGALLGVTLLSLLRPGHRT